MFLADYHIHSNFSTDTDKNASPERCAKRAASLGLSEICITDHMDFRYKTMEPNPPIDMDAYTARLLKVKDKFAGRVSVKLGLELGPHKENAHAMNELVSKYPLDFVICSTHDIKGLATWHEDDFFIDKSKREAHEEYFVEILDVISKFSGFSVYGHLDYLDRYAKELYDDPKVYYGECTDVVDAVMRKLVEMGKGLEVNTSGYRYGLGYPNPKPEFLRRFRELGGEIITLGSDAHCISHIGKDFMRAREMLLGLGFKYVASFDNMKPEMIKM